MEKIKQKIIAGFVNIGKKHRKLIVLVLAGLGLCLTVYYGIRGLWNKLCQSAFRKRLAGVALVCVILVTQTDLLRVLAENPDTGNMDVIQITGFEKLPEEIANQVVNTGTPLEELMLPDELTAYAFWQESVSGDDGLGEIETTEKETEDGETEGTNGTDTEITEKNQAEESNKVIKEDNIIPEEGNGEESGIPEEGSPEEGSIPEEGSPEEGSIPEEGNPEEGSIPEEGSPEESGIPEEGSSEESSIPEEDSSEESSIPEVDAADNERKEDNAAGESGAEEDGETPELETESVTVILPEHQAENVVTVEVLDGRKTVAITGITWESTAAYDKETEGEYIFTPVLPMGYELAEGADLPQIKVKVEADGQAQEPVITGWRFGEEEIYPQGMLFWDEEGYSFVLAGGDESTQIPFEDIVSLLPKSVMVQFLSQDNDTGITEQALSIAGWDCTGYARDENGKLPYRGSFLFTARLSVDGEEKEYALSEGVEEIGVFVVLEEPALLSTVNAVPGTITADEEWGMQTLAAGTYIINPGVTVTLTGTLTVDGEVIIKGGGQMVRGNDSAYFSVYSDGTFCLENITLDGASLSSSYSMIQVNSGGTVTLGDGCRIHHCVKNASQGAVLNLSGGTAVLGNTVIEDCSSISYGGAIYMSGVSNITINGGIYRNNATTGTSSYGGGFIYNRASTLKIYGGSFVNNSSPGRGGCIYNAGISGTETYLYGGYFQGNKSSKEGYAGSGALFYSSENTANTILNISGEVQLCGDGIAGSGTDGLYLGVDTSSTAARRAQISSELKYPLHIYLQRASEGYVIAEGVGGYTLQKKDMKKITFTDSSDSGSVWYAVLDEANNKIVLSTTNPGYSLYITYAGNGAQGTVVDNTEYSSGNTVIVKSGEGLSREGYVFDGWNTQPDGSGTAYRQGQEFTITGDIVLYAQWKKTDSYVLTFDANGGSVSPATVTIGSDGRPSVESLPVPVREGYTFDGWYTAAEGGTQIAADTVFRGNATAYAHWTAKVYTVTYHKNGGEITGEDSFTKYVHGTGLSLPVPVRTGYTFGGWYTDSSCTVGRTESISASDMGNKVYYAKWTDETPPAVTITGMQIVNGIKTSWGFIVGKQSIVFRLPVSDVTDTGSGVAALKYTAVSDKGDLTDGTAVKNGSFYEITIQAGFSGTIAIVAVDVAGNQSDRISLLAQDGKVVVEDTAPNVIISEPKSFNEAGWHNEVFYLTVTVGDKKTESGGEISCGIKEITWKDGADGTEHRVEGLPGAGPVYEKIFNILVDTDGVHEFFVRAVDNAGNDSGWKSISVKLDTKAPVFTEGPVSENTTDTKTGISFTASEEGKVYWLANPSRKPEAGDVRKEGTYKEVSGSKESSFEVTGLASGREQKVYMVLEDAAGNLSEVKEVVFATLQNKPDITPEEVKPDFGKETIKVPEGTEAYTNPANPEGSRLKPDESGYIKVVPGQTIYIRNSGKTDGESIVPAGPPVTITIKERPEPPAPKTLQTGEGTIEVTDVKPGEEYVIVKEGETPDWDNAVNTNGQFTGLEPETEYTVWVRKAATDEEFTSNPVSVTIKTPAKPGSSGTGGEEGGSVNPPAGGTNTPSGSEDMLPENKDNLSETADRPETGEGSEKDADGGRQEQTAKNTQTDNDKETEGEPTDAAEGTDEAQSAPGMTPTEEENSSETAGESFWVSGEENSVTISSTVEDGRLVPQAQDGQEQQALEAGGAVKTVVFAVEKGVVLVTVNNVDETLCTSKVANTAAVANAVLSEEELMQAAAGEAVEIRIDVERMDDRVPQEDKEVLQQGLEESRNEIPDLTMGMYVDISIFMRVGEGEWNAVHTTNEPVEIIVDVPEALQELDADFYIMRAHEGEYMLMSDMDDVKETITIQTGLFSTYAIAYQLKGAEGGKCSLCHICPTFLGICCFIWLLLAVVILTVLTGIFIKTRRNYRKEQ